MRRARHHVTIALAARLGGALAALLAVALVAAPAAPASNQGKAPIRHEADGQLAEWRGAPTMLAGRSQISRGELIYTDYLYDDYGPNLNGISDMPAFRSALAPRSGDYDYPDEPERYGYNGADLRELRLAIDKRRRLHALIALQTMKVPDAAVATVAIDTDGDAATGTSEWPGGAGLSTPGADLFITTWGAGAVLTDAAGATTPIDHAVNLDENAIELRVPSGLIGRPGSAARAWVATGLADADGAWRSPGGAGTAAYDLGFQGEESYDLTSHWGDKEQSAALASGDVSAFSEALRPRELRRRKTALFTPAPGYYNRIFRSANTYGEGIDPKQITQTGDPAGSAEPMFRGRFQPYGLYIPPGYSPDVPTPLLIDGHSLDVNHNEYAAVGTGQLTQLGGDRGSLIITPLARGIDTWYLDSGLVDVFEVWEDARGTYNADPERTSLTGYSMGGYLTYRLGLLMPDAFARASVYVGPPAFSFWPYPLPLQSSPEWEVPGNTNQIVENGLNLPFEINHGNLDELVPISGVLHQVDTFEAADNPYRFYHHLADDHFTFIGVANRWTHTREWLGDERRDLSPVRVRYVRYPSMDLPHAGLVFDGAYWVDGLEVRDADPEEEFGKIDATSFALGEGEPRLVDEGTSLSVGDAGVSPAIVTGQHYEPGGPAAARNAFSAELRNLAGIEFICEPMGLNPRRPVEGTLTGDGTTTVRLIGRFSRKVQATVDGSPVPVQRTRQATTITVDLSTPGQHRLVLARPG